jgi:hypothetical protein
VRRLQGVGRHADALGPAAVVSTGGGASVHQGAFLTTTREGYFMSTQKSFARWAKIAPFALVGAVAVVGCTRPPTRPPWTMPTTAPSTPPSTDGHGHTDHDHWNLTSTTATPTTPTTRVTPTTPTTRVTPTTPTTRVTPTTRPATTTTDGHTHGH